MQLITNSLLLGFTFWLIEFYFLNVNALQVIPFYDDDYYSSQSQEHGYFKSERSKKSNHLTTQQTRYTKPSILKYYLKNITITRGDVLQLECPTQKIQFNEPFLDASNELNKMHIRDIHFDESMKIKTVIWTQELDFPKLITNNEEILIKNSRFRLVSEDSHRLPKKNHDKNFLNDEYAIKQNIPYNLQICPVKNSDSGWYSCYVVKQSLHDQNIKFYTYVNVLDEIAQNQVNYEDYEQDYESLEIENKYDSYCDQLMMEKHSISGTTKSIEKPKISINNFNEKELVESSYDYKNQDSKRENDETLVNKERESVKILDKKNTIETSSNESKTMDLKRQIDLLIKKTDENTYTETVQAQKSGFLFDINSSENVKLKSTEYETEEKYKTVKRSRETLTVNPKHLNVSAYKSTQLDCVYNGPQYLSVKLVWFKNGVALNKNNQNTRFLILDYIQHNASICILKFSYALAKDAGVYTCSASDHSNETSFLNDSAKIVIDPRSNDNYFKFSSYLQDNSLSSNAQTDTKNVLHLCIIFIFNLLFLV